MLKAVQRISDIDGKITKVTTENLPEVSPVTNKFI